MAFLCPSRLGRNKQKRGHESLLERLAEGGSIDEISLEDLVKLSWKTPEARRIILQNFTAYAPQEITVKQGQKVNYIYRESDWAYVVTDDKKEGFVPYTFLAKIGVPSKPAPRKVDTGTYTKRVSDVNRRKISVESEGTDQSASDVADNSFTSSGLSYDSFTECGSIDTVKERPSVNYLHTEPLHKLPMFYEVFLDERTNILHKNPLPAPSTFHEKGTIHPADDIGPPSPSLMFKVMYNFAGQDVYDVPVKIGDIVHLLDDSDPGWFWVCKPDGTEGFVPSNYISELSEDSIDEIDISTEKSFTADHSRKGEAISKSYQDELPTKWKVTNDLKGKTPAQTKADSPDAIGNNTKHRPKKPPRKKKMQQNGMSPRLDDSMDSLDTCITDTSTEYLDYETKSSFGELSPRSNVFSESSILDSSFNEVYNHGPFGNNLFEELSPRSTNSLNVQTQRVNTDTDETLESNFAQEICDRSNNETRQNGDNRKDKRDEKSRYNFERATKEERGQEHVNVQQRKKHMSGSKQRQTSDSFESITSHGQRHRRPSSMPAFKSYQEYKKDYFDEYFYEDNNTEFVSRSKNDVVNVSEILKLRKSTERRQRSQTNERRVQNIKNTSDHSEVRKMSSANRGRNKSETSYREDVKSKENQSIHNQPKLKQFLLNLPSTRLDHKTGNTNAQDLKTVNDENITNGPIKKQAGKRFYSSTDVQNTDSTSKVENNYKRKEVNSSVCDMTFQQIESDVRIMKSITRQFNSSTDLRQTKVKIQNEGQPNENNNMYTNKSSKLWENKENINRHKMTNLRPYNSSTDLREIQGKPDWSFGYPRKTGKSIGRHENENQLNGYCINNKRSMKDTGKGKSQDKRKNEPKGSIRKVNNFIEGQSTGTTLKDSMQVYMDRKTIKATAVNENKSCNCAETEGNASLDDEAMMALLMQTDNLLHKTDTLLDDDETKGLDKTNEIDVPFETNDLLDKRTKELDTKGGKRLTKCSNKTHHTHNVDTNDKCNIFLENNTIGIHGMTYFITKDNTTNEGNIPKPHTAKQSDNFTDMGRRDNESKDLRKEKRNVMKENSSEIVSEELKSLDLQDIRGITEFICQCDYEPDTDNMLPIKHGEIVHVGLDGQDCGEWYWAFSPRLRKNGFVPKQYVKIPLVTII